MEVKIALCRSHVAAGREWWTSSDPREEMAAAHICKTGAGGDPCPLLVSCLEAALDLEERQGVWGGLTPPERHRIRPFTPHPRSHNTRKKRA